MTRFLNFPRTAVAATMLAALSQTVSAAQWTFAPVLRAGYTFDDNGTLSNNEATTTEIQGGLYEAAATFAYATERTNFDITPLLRWSRYNEATFNSNDQFLRMFYDHEGLRSNFQIRGDYGKQSTRTAERARADSDVNDPDDIPEDNTGLVSEFGYRERITISPRWRYDFTERTAMDLRASYRDVNYDTPLPNFVPYTNTRFSASLLRSFSERTRGYITGTVRQYDREEVVNSLSRDIDTYGFVVGLHQDLTKQTQFRMEIGMEESRPAFGESDSDIVGNIYYVKTTETVRFLAQYMRSLSASGSGQLDPRDSLNLTLNKQFTDRVDGGLAVRAYQTERSSNIPGDLSTREFGQFGAQLTVALTRAFSVQADYRFTYLDQSTVLGGAANSNEFLISFIYQPDAMMMSR